ncbi:MAG: hypothetical protein HQL76_00050 [Magnetococcales bacterium]|nr:hypothetical protein [Magnetococcales bacterium]
MKLYKFFSPVKEGPTVLHPLWRRDGGDSLLFMHQANDLGVVTGFVQIDPEPLLQSGFPVHKPMSLSKSLEIGGEAPISFRFPDGSVGCGPPVEMKPVLEETLPLLKSVPLLAFDVQALVNPNNEAELSRLMNEGMAFLRERYSEETAEDWAQDVRKHLEGLRGDPSVAVMKNDDTFRFGKMIREFDNRIKKRRRDKEVRGSCSNNCYQYSSRGSVISTSVKGISFVAGSSRPLRKNIERNDLELLMKAEDTSRVSGLLKSRKRHVAGTSRLYPRASVRKKGR